MEEKLPQIIIKTNSKNTTIWTKMKKNKTKTQMQKIKRMIQMLKVKKKNRKAIKESDNGWIIITKNHLSFNKLRSMLKMMDWKYGKVKIKT